MELTIGVTNGTLMDLKRQGAWCVYKIQYTPYFNTG